MAGEITGQICDDLLVLYQGEVVEQGTPQTLFSAPQHAYTRTLVDAIPGQRL